MAPTDTNTRTGGMPRNVLILAFLSSLVAYSAVSSSYYSVLSYVPDVSSQQDQENEIIMAASMKSPVHNTDEIIETPKKTSLLDSLAELNSLSSMECPKGFVRINDTHIPENLGNPTRKIPKIVFQTSRSRCITPRLYELTQKWRFPGWSYYFYDDDALMRILHEAYAEFPHLQLFTESCIKYGTIKADLWRYLVLWKYGGLYADLDSVPSSNFTGDTIRAEDDSFFVVESFHLLSQYFMAISPKHPLMFYSTQQSLLNLLRAPDTGKFNAALQTGPHALHMAFRIFMKDAGVEILEPWTKPVKAGIFVGTNNRSARAVGLGGGKFSDQYVIREDIGGQEKMENYKKMNMTHNQEDKNTPSGQSCISALWHGYMMKP
jgi:hypothetical protein